MSNKEWIDLIAKEFKVSNTVAKGMLHSMYVAKNILSIPKNVRKEIKEKEERQTREIVMYEAMDYEDSFHY